MPKSLPLFTMTVTELLRTRNNSITGTVYALLRRPYAGGICRSSVLDPKSQALESRFSLALHGRHGSESAGKVVDRYETVFGLRSFRWDSATGFYLNDKPLKNKRGLPAS